MLRNQGVEVFTEACQAATYTVLPSYHQSDVIANFFH